MINYPFSLQSSLETLEEHNWGDPSEAPTSLVRRCIELSKIPLADFSISDLRLMIEQQFGLPYLIPMALEKLKNNIFIEADYFGADLLSNILDVDTAFWRENQNYWMQFNHLISDKRQELVARKISTTKFDSAKL